MENDPTLHHDQQNQADHFLKAQGAQKASEFTKDSNGAEETFLPEEEKEQQTKPEDFEKFDLDDLENTDNN